MKLSIIIPTLQEEATIGNLLGYLRKSASPDSEVIIADGGSTDATQSIAVQLGTKVVACQRRGRGFQMNRGAEAATGDVLYFLHADTLPPTDFEESIKQAVTHGWGCGCFRLKFDSEHWFLKLNAWFTRLDVNALRFGDQSLFVRRDVFEQTGGFDESMLLLEDQEIIGRLRCVAPFKILRQYVTTSARKYKQVGCYKLQAGYFLIYTLYRLGLRQDRLVQTYKWLLKP